MTCKQASWQFCVALGLLSLVTSEQAHATLITFAYTAEVTFVSDDGGFLNGQVSVGDAWTGSYTFDCSTPDSYPADATRGEYPRAITANSGMVGEVAYAATPGFANSISVSNGFLGLFDRYLFVAETTVLGSEFHFFTDLSDLQSNAFSDDVLPIVPPELEPFELTHIEMNNEILEVNVAGNITSLTLVPEPGGGVLFVIVGGILLLRHKDRVLR